MEESFEVEKNIPIPPRKGGGRLKYPYKQMEVGDSFFVPNKTASDLGYCFHTYGKRHNMKFISRTVEGGTRVWRIE